MEIGKTNKLKAARATDNGFYLEDSENNEVLLPNAYVDENLSIGDEIEVFIYRDSEDRLVATTLKPYVQLEEFAYLQVKEVNKFGAFMDWGLLKDLMVPFAEQPVKMVEGEWYLIFLLKDDQTQRLIGSAGVNEFVYFDEIDVKMGDEVDLLLYTMTDLGMNCIVNNMYKGLIFKSDIHKNIHPGDRLKGFVKLVREDGKIDIRLEPMGYENSIDQNSDIILSVLKEKDGFLNLTDKSTPDDIKTTLGLSKKAFKKALGNLYRRKIVELKEDGIKLLYKQTIKKQIMTTRKAKSIWNGTLKEGKGVMNFSDYNGPFTFASRFEEGKGTNPEELVGAAHSGCYSMFLAALIGGEGLDPESVETSAVVTLGEDNGPCITNIKLTCNVSCDGLSQEKFEELAAAAKSKCPVSRLYAGGTAVIELDAKLVG